MTSVMLALCAVASRGVVTVAANCAKKKLDDRLMAKEMIGNEK